VAIPWRTYPIHRYVTTSTDNSPTALTQVRVEEVWDDENVIRHESVQARERNRYIQILLEESVGDVDLPKSLNVTPSFDDYRDYQCFEGCGCDQIPAEDKCKIARNHFHYYHEGYLYWSNLTNDRLDTSNVQNERGSFAALIQEVDVDLRKTYEIHSHADYTLIGSKLNGIQFSLQFLALIKARDHFRQVLSVSGLKTYHGNEYLHLRNVLAENLGIPPKISRLVLPSLREPRHFEGRSAGINWENRYARLDSLRFGIKDYQTVTALPPKFQFTGIIVTKEDLWALLYLFFITSWQPGRSGVGTVLINRVDWYWRKQYQDRILNEQREDYSYRKQIVEAYYKNLFPNAQ